MKTAEYRHVIGTGGIGSGILFEMDGNRALSRNETRLAHLSPAKDYCKQHIILHYIARILTPDVSVHAIGAVGDDQPGRALLQMMAEAGIDATFVARHRELPTMYAVCLQYPDKAICNVTTANSASAAVSAVDIEQAIAALPFAPDRGTIAIAVPEVPLEARLTLLSLAKNGGAFCVASFLSDEAGDFARGDGIRNTDLLVINEDEAAAFLGDAMEDPQQLVSACYRKVKEQNPSALLAITFGAEGSYPCQGDQIVHLPAVPVKVVATGGAGDAFVAGTVCGLALGLPFLPGGGPSAAQLGASLAAESITKLDSIADSIDKPFAMEVIRKMTAGER